MSQINTIIFDMDGVIIDSEPIHKAVEQQLFSQLGINISEKEHDAFTGMSGQNMWEQIISRYELEMEVSEALDRNNDLYEQTLKAQKSMSPISGVKELIQSLHQKGYQLILASSSVMNHINLVLGMFGLEDFFMHKISGGDLANSKPHPEIFLTAAAFVEVSPSQCIVIEDSENGVKAAKAAGMKCVGYKSPHSGNQDLSLADLVVDKFDGLEEMML